MRLFSSVVDPGCRWLAKHFHRLRRTLEGLYDRLRDAIAVAVARAAEDAVREGVSALLADTPPLNPPDYPAGNYPRSQWRPSTGWKETDDEDDELRRWEESSDYEPEPQGQSEARAQVSTVEPAAEPARLRRALAQGLQAAGWWLRRSDHFPALTALAAGLVVVLASYAGGPPRRRRRRPGWLDAGPAVHRPGHLGRLCTSLTNTSAHQRPSSCQVLAGPPAPGLVLWVRGSPEATSSYGRRSACAARETGRRAGRRWERLMQKEERR
jgi:hypothetical protein